MRVDVGVVTTYICMCACVFHLSCSLTLSVRDNCSTVTAVVTLLQFWSLPLSCFVAVIKGCLSKPSSLGAGCGGTRIERNRNMMSMAFIDGHLRNVQDAHPPTSRRGFRHRVYKVLIVGGYDHTMFWGLSEDKILNSIPGSFQSLPHFPYSLIDLLSGTNPLFWSNLCGYVSMAQNSWPKNGWLSRQNNPFLLVDWYPMANNPGPHSHGQA